MRFLLPLLLAGNLYAGQISIAPPYHGINDTDPSVTLADGEAQDLLNVEVSKDGNSIVKRSGYSLLDTMAVAPTTAPIHGSIMFRNSSGDNIEVYANDVAVYKSANSGAYTQFITTATVGAKWSFCAGSGIVYAFNDKHDEPFSYNGTTVVYYPGMPKASLCAMTPTRMILAGTTDYPNRLYFSGEGDYTNFTLDTDPEDPSFDDVGMSGDKITGLWANASEWLIWKTNSMISYQGTNQYDLVASVISNKVGLSDPQARVEHGGVIYFRGTDAKIWAYSGGMLVDTTEKLETFTRLSFPNGVGSKQYSSKVDFDGGTYYQVTSDITNNVIEPSTHGVTDTLDADFNAGTVDPALDVADDMVSLVSLSTSVSYAGYFVNIGAESNNATTNWTETYSFWSHWNTTPLSGLSASYGSYYFNVEAQWTNGDTGTYYNKFYIKKVSDDSIVYSNLLNGYDVAPSWKSTTTIIDMSGYDDVQYYIEESCYPGGGAIMRSDPFTKGTITLTASVKLSVVPQSKYCAFDIEEISPAGSSGTFISQIFNIPSTGTAYGQLLNTSSVTTGSTIDFYIRTSSSSSGNFSTWETLTGDLTYTTTGHAQQYRFDLIATTNTLTTPSVSEVTLKTRATGYWESPETLSPATSWGVFLANETSDGSPHWTYQMKSSTYVGGTDIASYGAVTSGAVISISTGTYVKVKATNSFTDSSGTVKLNDLTYNYSFVYVKMASAFEYLGDIYFAVPYLGSVTNNRVMKYDISAGGWTIFDIPMNAPLISGNNVHFGSPTDGKIYTYPSGGNDNGAAINAYWKSKDYMGDNVYVTRTFDKLSLFMDSDYSSDVDATYSIEPSTSITYNIALTQTDGSLYIRNNRQLPAGTSGSIFNLKLANNAADKPFRFFGSVIDYTDDSWAVYP